MKALISKRTIENGNSDCKKSIKVTFYFCGIPIYHSTLLINQGEQFGCKFWICKQIILLIKVHKFNLYFTSELNN